MRSIMMSKKHKQKLKQTIFFKIYIYIVKENIEIEEDFIKIFYKTYRD